MAIVWMKDIHVHTTALWIGFHLIASQLQKNPMLVKQLQSSVYQFLSVLSNSPV